MATYNSLLLSTVEELQLTQQEANMFTEPHFIGRRYSRNIIYTIDNYQMALLEQIIHFVNARTLREKQRDLVMFLESNENYKDNNYKLIFCHLAHDFCIRHYRRIDIPHVDFRVNTFRNQLTIHFAFTQEAAPQQPQLHTHQLHQATELRQLQVQQLQQVTELRRLQAQQRQLQHETIERLRLEVQKELHEIQLELQAQMQRDEALIQRLRSQYQEPTSPISQLNNEFENLRIH